MTNFDLSGYKPTHSLSEFEFLQDPKDNRSKLGLGSFATVKLAREKKTGTLFALKLIDIHPSKVSKADIDNLKMEIQIHKELDHPHIIKFHGYMHEGNMVYLILDYASNGNLYTYLHKKKSLPEKEVFKFFFQTCLAISYLHYNDILHRDIKPENMLLDKDFNIKVCDFGWSAYQLDEGRNTFCGTYEYMAPEIVNKKQYDYRIDIWGMGILLYELFHNKAPYQGRTMQEIKNSLSKGKINFNPEIPSTAKSLILRILKTDPENRTSIGQILSDPWVVSNLDKDEKYQKKEEKPKKKDEKENNAKLAQTNLNQSEAPIKAPSKPKQLHISTGTSKNIFLANHLQSKEVTGSFSATNNSAKVKKEGRKPLQNYPINIQKQPETQTKSIFGEKVTSPHSAVVLSAKLFEESNTPRAKFEKTKRIFDESFLSPEFNTRLQKVFKNLNVTNSNMNSQREDGMTSLNLETDTMENISHHNANSRADLHVHSPSDYFFEGKIKNNTKSFLEYGSFHGGNGPTLQEFDTPKLTPSFSSPNLEDGAENIVEAHRGNSRKRVFREIIVQNEKPEDLKTKFSSLATGGLNLLKNLLASPINNSANSMEKVGELKRNF
jgi:serine/threonine protein kinase